MAETKVFHNITSELFACSKQYSEKHFRGKYIPPNANQGTTTISIDGHFPTPPTIFDLGFDFGPSTGDLTYTLIQKQGYLPVSAAWSVLEKGIDACGCKGTEDQNP
jgi:hypothetical protein